MSPASSTEPLGYQRPRHRRRLLRGRRRPARPVCLRRHGGCAGFVLRGTGSHPTTLRRRRNQSSYQRRRADGRLLRLPDAWRGSSSTKGRSTKIDLLGLPDDAAQRHRRSKDGSSAPTLTPTASMAEGLPVGRRRDRTDRVAGRSASAALLAHQQRLRHPDPPDGNLDQATGDRRQAERQEGVPRRRRPAWTD